MYLCKKLTDLSFPEIGKLFNDKHHSTVMYSVEKIAEASAPPTPTSTAPCGASRITSPRVVGPLHSVG